MLGLWQHADGRSQQEIQTYFEEEGLKSRDVSAALVCLARAGLLSYPQAPSNTDHSVEVPYKSEAHVSVLIISYNSLAWLPGCLASLVAQSHPYLETVVVDNGSSDGSADWLAEHHPNITLVRLEQSCSLATAINHGVEVIHGDYILLLNPDVVLDPHAVSCLLEVAQSNPDIAAVAAKLRLMWAPAFLNGLGNLVGALSWGTDSALGYLDLGQFDRWNELPSACFAAALLPVKALNEIGPLDDGLPMYYEDTEWCYRARLFGHAVCLAPQAVVYHAFSGRVPDGVESSLEAVKLQRVVYGRLRFITRLLGFNYLLRFFVGYLLEDMVYGLVYLVRGRWGHLRAYWRAWLDYFNSLDDLRLERKILQQRRSQTDWALFNLQRQSPVPLVWRGLPLLTWDIVRHEYAPWIESRQTGRPKMTLQRALSVWRVEGIAALLHRIGRGILWKWMQL
jgi:GT2 family glycosyltransferase